MNYLQQLYPGDSIASFLIRVLAEITLVTSVALVFARVAVRRNPALRHGVCVCALMCVLVAPITTLALQRMGWRTLQISLESDQNFPILSSSPTEVQPASIATIRRPFWTLERARDAASLILLIWAAGSGFLVVRLIGGMKKVRRLRMGSFEVDDPKLRRALSRLIEGERMPSVPVRVSRRLNSPVVVGPSRTTVLLPEKLLVHLSEDQLKCVLAHELTHVRQRDPLIGLIQRIVEAGYWPHPFVHLLNRDLIRAREEVCDNVALHGTTAPQYADTLLTVALGIAPRRTAAPGGVGLMTPPWKLEERVKGLLDPHRRLTTTMNTRHLAFMAISLASGIALIAGASVVAAPNPPSFQQVVELHSSYNAKTHAVEVKAKSHRVQATKTIRVSRAKVKSVHEAANSVSSYSVDITPHTVKSNDVIITQATPVKVRQINVTPKIVNPVHFEYSVSTTTTANPVINQEKVNVVTSDPVISKVVSDDYSVAYAAKVVDALKGDTVAITKSADGKTTTSSNVFVQQKSVDSNPVIVQAKSNDPTSLKLETYTITTQDGNRSENLVKELTKGTGNLYLQKAQKVELVDPAWAKTDGKIFFLDGKKVQLADPTWTKNVPKFFVQEGNSKVWNSKDVFEVAPWTVMPKGTKVRVRYEPRDSNIWEYTATAKHSPTTIYIKGGDIKIVGDQIKVVYLKPDSPKGKTQTKTDKSKSKPK